MRLAAQRTVAGAHKRRISNLVRSSTSTMAPAAQALAGPAEVTAFITDINTGYEEVRLVAEGCCGQVAAA
jgi:hypothetical protein